MRTSPRRCGRLRWACRCSDGPLLVDTAPFLGDGLDAAPAASAIAEDVADHASPELATVAKAAMLAAAAKEVVVKEVIKSVKLDPAGAMESVRVLTCHDAQLAA